MFKKKKTSIQNLINYYKQYDIKKQYNKILEENKPDNFDEMNI